ncbi:hypothetical protein GCM10027085_59630 [Spirosoma aerophilum]
MLEPTKRLGFGLDRAQQGDIREKDPPGSPKIKQVNGYRNRYRQQTKQKGRIEKIHSGYFGKQDFLINDRL